MSGPSASDKAQERAISQQQVAIGQEQNARAGQLFNLTFPGMGMAEDWYRKLASGDPTAIQRAIAPASEQVAAQTEAAKQRIQTEAPRGGEQRLALENADISKASQIGRLATGAFTGSFPALASLAGTGIGLSANEIANALAGFQGGAATTNNIMQNDASTKAATMGMVGQLGSAAAMGAGTAVCWIATALWGVADLRTMLVRRWLNSGFCKSRGGRAVVALYSRYGRQAARLVRRFTLARAIATPLFEAALRRAHAWEGA
jgi:hypothetical protein